MISKNKKVVVYDYNPETDVLTIEYEDGSGEQFTKPRISYNGQEYTPDALAHILFLKSMEQAEEQGIVMVESETLLFNRKIPVEVKI